MKINLDFIKKYKYILAISGITILVFFGWRIWHFGVSKIGVEELILPENFVIEKMITNLEGPRVIEFDDMGRMLISETKAGKIKIVESGQAKDLLTNLNSPHGLAFYKDTKANVNYLYVAESDKVNRYIYNNELGQIINKGENIINLPGGGRHFTRTILFGPNYRTDQIISGGNLDTLTEIKLYTSVGSSCDVCVEDTWKRAAILESDPEGSFIAEFAGGLRNSVFMAVNPDTNQIWATEMGRDNLGDDVPPDEINIIRVPDKNDEFGAKRYGWPFCYGNKIKDESFKPGQYTRQDLDPDCSKTITPEIEIPAHSAPLGLVFVNSKKFPADWQGDLLVAYHGSWNRSQKTGYRIVRFKKGDNSKYEYLGDLINWLDGDKVLGRPVDLKFGPDGALYVSDDYGGSIYRITYQ